MAREDDVADLLLVCLGGAQLAFDRAPEGVDLQRRGEIITIAFDKAGESVRRTDDFARLHVKSSPITKACINPYYGREIPRAKELGLDPNKVYRLLRHPDEIKKAAKTFHNIPLLSKHVPHTADDHDGDITVGTTGSEAEYVHPYLMNSLAVWSRDGIDHVESGDQKELSSAYSYDADMTPGVYEGEPYDGVMRNMVGNHVALVKKGRAGSDVVVGDEALQPDKETTMSTKTTKIASLRAGMALGALRGHFLASKLKLAQDAALPDFSPLFTAVKPGKFKAAIPTIVAGVQKGLKGKLAQDADLGGIVKGVEQLMTAVEGDKTVADADVADPAAMEDPGTGELDPDEPVMDGSCEAIAAYLKSKGVPDDVIAGMPGMAKEGGEGGATDGPTDEMAARLARGGAKDKDEVVEEEGDDGKGGKKKPFAMDEATFAKRLEQTRKTAIADMNAVSDARKHVRPIVGEIEMAFDSAAGVYQQAFKMVGNTDAAKQTDAAVLKSMWNMVPVKRHQPELAQDSATDGEKPFHERFPNAAKVRKHA